MRKKFQSKVVLSGVEPNVVKAYDVNDDYTEWTIHLREGMKWSDGEPFTSRDITFWWDHIMTPEIFGRSVYDAFHSVDAETGERTRGAMERPYQGFGGQTFDHRAYLTDGFPRISVAGAPLESGEKCCG